ncbi:MAG: hypothetical protein ACK53L_19525, partial [Pirellulaceae bacterium]
RLGLPPIEGFNPTHCWCGANIETHPSHGLSHSSIAVDQRHDDIKARICRLLQRAGFAATTEDKFQLTAGNHRSDIRVVIEGKVHHLDISVIHPTADSYLSAAAKEPLGASKLAQDDKELTYSPLAKAQGEQFVACTIETTVESAPTSHSS